MKATHSGHCQCCGAPQKLPGGRLAKHGYTVRFGFFEGVCMGTGELPFEQSCDLVKTFVAAAQVKRADLVAYQARLRQPAAAGVTKAWVHAYYAPTWDKRAVRGYRWEEREIIATPRQTPGGEHRWIEYSYVDANGKSHRIDFYGAPVVDLATACTRLNGKRADDLEDTIKQIDGYITWQDGRVKSWKPAELTAVK